ncbi:hypothetical protein bcgnr5378_06310 [Bacillus cereus]|uniref:hypothetical protein n=1 Tax=Bacillus cereus TaxID=1396 RepID=UPI000B284166|nr:hypothetical protein [Bacillus cereus]
MEFMVGTFKFEAGSVDDALLIAKKQMFEMGWRNLRLMTKDLNGWKFCSSILSFETE